MSPRMEPKVSYAQLSDRRKQILRVIQECQQRDGYAPSVREIAELVGLKSASTIKHHLDTLEAQGFLSRSAGKPRALDVISPEECLNPPATSQDSGTTVHAVTIQVSDGKTGKTHFGLVEKEDSSLAGGVSAGITSSTTGTGAGTGVAASNNTGTRTFEDTNSGSTGTLGSGANCSTDTSAIKDATDFSTASFTALVDGNTASLGASSAASDSVANGAVNSFAALAPTPDNVIMLPVGGDDGNLTSVPLVGRIAAGAPITAEQQMEEVFALPTALTGHGQMFMLEVHGDSMIEAAICDGDYVVVRRQRDANSGEIVAAMIDGEATVKTLLRRDGHQWLLPQNPNYSPIPGDEATILGKVVTVIRTNL